MMSIFDTFKLRAEAVSAEVHRFPRKTEALDFIVDYLRIAGVADSPQSYAVWADCPFLDGIDKQQLARAGSRPHLRRHPREGGRGQGWHQPVGLGHGQHRHAGAGRSCRSNAAWSRRLPCIHIALIETSRLLPDMPSC